MTPFQDEPAHVRCTRAERHANADLARPPAHEERHGRVKPRRREQAAPPTASVNPIAIDIRSSATLRSI